MSSPAVRTTQSDRVSASLKPFASPEKRTFVFSLLLIVFTLVLYNPANHFSFINYDDNHYISENPHVGLLFVDFAEQIGLHINGRAQIVENDEFLKFLQDHPAEQAVLGDAVLKDMIESDGGHLERWMMVAVVEAYVQCSKHIPPMQRMDHNIQWGMDTGHHVHGGDYFGTAHDQK